MKNLRKYSLLLLAAMLLTVGLKAQTMPVPQTLPFQFTAIDTTGFAAGTCTLPEWISVHSHTRTSGKGADYNYNYEPNANGDSWPIAPDTTTLLMDANLYKGAGSTGGWSRYGDDGITIVGHSSGDGNGARGIVTAISTKGKNNIKVFWKSTLVKTTGARHNNALALQYKLGALDDGTSFVTLPNTAFNYNLAPASPAKTVGTFQLDTCLLPAELENQDTVYIRWVYWMSYRADGGARDQIAINGVKIAETSATFAETYPKFDSATTTSALMLFKTDLPSTVYFVLSESNVAPTKEALLADAAKQSASVSSTESKHKFASLTAGTEYYVHLLFQHGGDTTAVSTYQFSTVGSSLEFSTGFPTLSDTTYNSITLNAKTTMAARLYYLVSTSQQTLADLTALKAATGVVKGDSALSAATEVNISIANLSANTPYYLYYAAEGSSETAVQELSFTTKRNLVSFATDFPKTDKVVRDGFNLLSKTDKAANLYYKVSETQQSYANAAALIADGAVGPKALAANADDTTAVSSLDASKLYYVYVVAQNSDNEETNVVELQVTTTSSAPAFVFDSIINITNTTFDYKVKADIDGTLYYIVKEQQPQHPIYTAAELVAHPDKKQQALTANVEWKTTFNGSKERRYYVYAVLAKGNDYSEVKRSVKTGDVFTIEGALAPAPNRNSSGTRLVEVVVPQHLDISNIPNDKIIYALGDSTIWTQALPNDYSADIVQRTARDTAKATETNYNLIVRNLLPADNLPLSLAFGTSNPSQWSRTTKGWAGAGIDGNQSSVIRFGTLNVSFLVAFTDIADSISYEVTTVGGPFVNTAITGNPEFLVEGSANGYNWITLRHFDKNNTPNVPDANGTTKYTEPVGDSIRFVRFYYKNRDTRNMNINNVMVTTKAGLPYFDEGYPLLDNIWAEGVDLSLGVKGENDSVFYKVSSTPQSYTAAELAASGSKTYVMVGELKKENITSLNPKTDYYVYVVAKNAAGKFSAVKEYRFRTTSSQPDFTTDFPQLGDIAKKQIDAKVKVEKSCKVHYLISDTQKAAGYTNKDLMAEAHDSVAVSANVQQTISFRNLTPGTHYYMYFTTRDNLDSMATLEMLEASTLAASHLANIVSFSILGQSQEATIDTVQGLVIVTVPEDMDLTSIIPTFTLSDGAELRKIDDNSLIVSNISRVDLTDTLFCKVIAEEPSISKSWRIKVNTDEVNAVSKNTLGFTLYPNPFRDELYISCADEVELLQIISMQGQVVLSQYNTSTLQTSTLPKGMYILKVQSKSGKVGSKIVVKQ